MKKRLEAQLAELKPGPEPMPALWMESPDTGMWPSIKGNAVDAPALAEVV